jgi:hypothetical protein
MVLHWPRLSDSLLLSLRPRVRQVELLLNSEPVGVLDVILGEAGRFDRLLFHLALTDQQKLPVGKSNLLLSLRRRGINLWNADLPDLSKHQIQRWNRKLNLPSTASQALGSDEELLIVKTRFNAFADTESQLNREERAILGYPMSWSNPIDEWNQYPVLHRCDVPAAWWKSNRLCIERFIENSDGAFARIFLVGQSVVICSSRSKRKIKRLDKAFQVNQLLLERRNSAEPDFANLLSHRLFGALKSAVRFADAIGLDYGAIDIVFDESLSYIVDVNPTPQWGPFLDPVTKAHLIKGMQGIYE